MKKNVFLRAFVTCTLVCFTLFVNIKLPIFAAEEEEVKELSFNSVVEVESYAIEEGYIEAGKEAIVDLTLHNANRRTSAEGIFVSVSSSSGMIYPSYGNDNQFFVGSLEADGTATVSIPVVVNSNFIGEYVDLTCNIVYVSSGKQISNTATMILPARDSNTIIVSSIDVSSHAKLNNKSLLSISYYNKSSENVNEASLQIIGNVSDSTKTINLGSVLGGKAYSEDRYLIFSESGDQNVSITLNYADINGEQKQIDLGNFKVSVDDDDESVTSVNNAGNEVLQTTGAFIALIAAAAVIVVVAIYIRKR